MAEPNPSTVNDVIAALDSLHGETVRVAGVLQVEFEGNSLWHSPTSERKPGYGSSLWAESDYAASGRSPGQLREFNGRHVVVTAVVDGQFTGHFGLWPGALQIRAVIKAKAVDA